MDVEVAFKEHEVQFLEEDGKFHFLIPALGIVGIGGDIQTAFSDFQSKKGAFRDISRTLGAPPVRTPRAGTPASQGSRSIGAEIGVFSLKLLISIVLLSIVLSYSARKFRVPDIHLLTMANHPVETAIAIGDYLETMPEERRNDLKRSLALIHDTAIVPLTTGSVSNASREKSALERGKSERTSKPRPSN